ncbi:MAG: outer membrane protein assembly factor [Cytophagales bacterium]|nr:outer membrane protein assembly factor [Cytophagales bacterium]
MKTYLCLFVLLTFLPVAAQTDTARYRNAFTWAPFMGYSPETNFLFGANGKYLFKPGSAAVDTATRTSFVQATTFYTLSNQFRFIADYNVFTKNERFNFSGEAGFASVPIYYYGIGNLTERTGRELFSFKNISFGSLGLYRFAGKWFAGAGYSYSRFFDLQLRDNGTLATQRPTGWNGSVSSGLHFVVRLDSRNSLLNAHRGTYLNAAFLPRTAWLGSQFVYQKYLLDARKYWSLRRQDPYREVIAVQVYGEFSNGEVPFTDLSLLGNSMIMRGYYAGRFRDNHFVAAQVEYRRALNSWFGVVGFVGAGEGGGQPAGEFQHPQHQAQRRGGLAVQSGAQGKPELAH